jgi:hypothetical protein
MHTIESIARITKTNLPAKNNKVQKVQLQGGQGVLIGTENKIVLSEFEKKQIVSRYKAIHGDKTINKLFKTLNLE